GRHEGRGIGRLVHVVAEAPGIGEDIVDRVLAAGGRRVGRGRGCVLATGVAIGSQRPVECARVIGRRCTAGGRKGIVGVVVHHGGRGRGPRPEPPTGGRGPPRAPPRPPPPRA